MSDERTVGPGDKLYGYCNGYFGRDSYGDKLVIACGTWGDNTWIVVSENGRLNTAIYPDRTVPAEWFEEVDWS